MARPQRIQLKRTKGWRKPEGAVVVSRPSRWGNPYKVVKSDRSSGGAGIWHVSRGDSTWTPETDSRECATELAVRVYRGNLLGFWNASFREQVVSELRGRDLACWCPLDHPCHADVLLEVANRGEA